MNLKQCHKQRCKCNRKDQKLSSVLRIRRLWFDMNCFNVITNGITGVEEKSGPPKPCFQTYNFEKLEGGRRTERKSCFPMSLTSSPSSRDRNKYGRIGFMLQTERLSSINCIAIAERASREEVDRPWPYSAIFISVTWGRLWHQRHRKTRFSFGYTSAYVILC